MKFMSVDLETTGLKAGIHSIIEFGAVYSDFGNTFEPKSFYGWVYPEGMIWSQYCLNMHSKWIETVNRRVREKTLHQYPIIYLGFDALVEAFKDWFATLKIDGKITAAGKNFANFDLKFLEAQLFPQLFRHRILDPGVFYWRKGDTVLCDFATCKERAIQEGCVISPKVEHNALDDAMDIVKLIHHYYKDKL